MTDRSKFEEMLEKLVNEDRAGAEELFHEIVVEKSRDIYENLLSEETDEEVDEATDEEVDESDEDLDEATDEEVDESDKDLEEGFFGEGDPTDDMMAGITMPGEEGGAMADEPEMGDEMDDDEMGMGDEEGSLEDTVMDLADELEALKAEFQDMMGDMDDDAPADDDMGDEEMPMDMDSEEEPEEEAMAFETTDEEVDEAADEDLDEGSKSQTEMMREYTDKVSASMGDNGANAKSPMAGANNMGGTSANIAKGGEADTKGTAGGLAQPTTKEISSGNVNVPGGKASKSLKAQPGHGAEKKGKPENAGDKGSMLNGAPKRAK